MIQVPLTADKEALLREQARQHGEDVSVYASRLLNDALTAPSVDELLAPFREQIEASGATDEELENLVEELREETWRERQAKKAHTA